jgi:conjugal transfer mating pair stabilization protein TraN
MDCWVDAQGQAQCPNNDGGHDTCKELEDDPNCGFLRETCLEGAELNGVCFVKEQTWDCGTLHSIPVLKREQSIDCAGPVRCMGTDCVNPGSEQSADFAKAVAALEAAQMMATDMQCDPNGECRVFGGERNECKRAVGGIVNCCTTPEGVSLGNYLTLVFSLAKLDSAILGMNKGGAIRGSWETLRQPLTSTWSAVTESFSSVANSLTGTTAEAATDAAAQGVLAAAKQEVLSKTVTWAAQTFGESAVNVLFSGVNGGAAISNGTVSSALQLGGGQAWLGSLMAWAMWAYTIYTVAMILIKIIWTCEKKEFELGAKRQIKACHNVGGYCKSEVLGWCIEKRETYCCFNTPLARILNEQIRPQLGRGWGSPKNPDCKGINVQDFSRVDWSRVNLDEWLAILFETGHFPTAETINLESLTGTGRVLSGGNRGNSVERSVGRTTGLDAEQTRRDAEAELWSDALPNLP